MQAGTLKSLDPGKKVVSFVSFVSRLLWVLLGTRSTKNAPNMPPDRTDKPENGLSDPKAATETFAKGGLGGLSGLVRSCQVAALSREGVVSSHSVMATGLVSRHGVKFGTLRVCQF